MARSNTQDALPREIVELLSQTHADDPVDAMRIAARRQLAAFFGLFPDEGPPMNMLALASFRSIRTTDDPPVFSPDAEILPDDRGLVMRLNRQRPVTRQRFSIGHEIGHTLVPGFEMQVQCRKPRNRDWAGGRDIVEFLCDVASSEFLFPLEWFSGDIATAHFAADSLVRLASRYQASPDATVRRFVELTRPPTAAIFFRWKLSDTEVKQLPDRRQKSLPGVHATGLVRKLRVDYPLTNDAFDQLGLHIPKNKSVDDRSIIHQAACAGAALDSPREEVDLGAFRKLFRVIALPLFTQDADKGPNGESAVVAVLQPVAKARSR
jgi:Zn-dependent peptidase ImmA (M78 family)